MATCARLKSPPTLATLPCALAAATTKADAERKRSTGRGSTVAALLMCYAKALALQVRGRADGRPVMTNATLSDDLYPGHVGQVRPAAQAGPAVCGVWRVALDLRGGLGVWDVWRMPPIPLKPFFYFFACLLRVLHGLCVYLFGRTSLAPSVP